MKKAPLTLVSAVPHRPFPVPTAMQRPFPALLCTTVLLLSGCEYIGLQPVSQIEARIEAEGKAVGGACRHAGRALEDCYALNEKVSKAAIFEGWREMNDYMAQHRLPEIPPTLKKEKAVAPAQATPQYPPTRSTAYHP
ncbi:MAG: hypothetical protein WCY07_05505 [Pigmentiphaga sp.]